MPQQPAAYPLGLPFIELQSVDSTNNYALQRVHAGLAQHGEAIFALDQTAGKGQRGKQWNTEPGTAILLSVVTDPRPLQLTQQFQFSAFAAVAAAEFFSIYAGDDTRIKWPNDIYWQDRKAGGILLESVVGPSENDASIPLNQISTIWRWAVIGIGININQTVFPGDLPNPVSLKQITGKDFNTNSLAKELCSILDKKYKQLLTEGFESIYQQYHEKLYLKNKIVKLKQGSRVFEARIKAVTPAGRLLVTHSFEEDFEYGAIEWLI